MLLIGKLSISMGHLYHGYVSHNQRVLVVYSSYDWVKHSEPLRQPRTVDIIWLVHRGCHVIDQIIITKRT